MRTTAIKSITIPPMVWFQAGILPNGRSKCCADALLTASKARATQLLAFAKELRAKGNDLAACNIETEVAFFGLGNSSESSTPPRKHTPKSMSFGDVARPNTTLLKAEPKEPGGEE